MTNWLINKKIKVIIAPVLVKKTLKEILPGNLLRNH